jgi:hypothetical protein
MATRKSNTEAMANGALNDLDLVISVDDGVTGHYITMPVPSFDSLSDDTKIHMVSRFIRDKATRDFQAKSKPAAKKGEDVASVLAKAQAEFEAKPYGDLLTIASLRNKLATERLTDALKKAGRPHDPATVAKALPSYMAVQTRQDAVEASLHSFLAAGYTPSRKGQGEATGETGASVNTEDLE